MPAIQRDSLMTLEAYAKARKDFRARVLAHKKDRTVHLGEHLTLLFEDELTIRYQVQEMLRAEDSWSRPGALEDELRAYNPLIPGHGSLSATLMLEYETPAERAQRQCLGICGRGWSVAKNCQSRLHSLGLRTWQSAFSLSRTRC